LTSHPLPSPSPFSPFEIALLILRAGFPVFNVSIFFGFSYLEIYVYIKDLISSREESFLY